VQYSINLSKNNTNLADFSSKWTWTRARV